MKNQTGPTNAGKPWDEHQDAQLRALIARGMSFEEIAHEMQRTVAGIEARAERLGCAAHLPLCDPESGCERCRAHRLRIATYLRTLVERAPDLKEVLTVLLQETGVVQRDPDSRLEAAIRNADSLVKEIDRVLFDPYT